MYFHRSPVKLPKVKQDKKDCMKKAPSKTSTRLFPADVNTPEALFLSEDTAALSSIQGSGTKLLFLPALNH